MDQYTQPRPAGWSLHTAVSHLAIIKDSETVHWRNILYKGSTIPDYWPHTFIFNIVSNKLLLSLVEKLRMKKVRKKLVKGIKKRKETTHGN